MGILYRDMTHIDAISSISRARVWDRSSGGDGFSPLDCSTWYRHLDTCRIQSSRTIWYIGTLPRAQNQACDLSSICDRPWVTSSVYRSRWCCVLFAWSPLWYRCFTSRDRHSRNSGYRTFWVRGALYPDICYLSISDRKSPSPLSYSTKSLSQSFSCGRICSPCSDRIWTICTSLRYLWFDDHRWELQWVIS